MSCPDHSPSSLRLAPVLLSVLLIWADCYSVLRSSFGLWNWPDFFLSSLLGLIGISCAVTGTDRTFLYSPYFGWLEPVTYSSSLHSWSSIRIAHAPDEHAITVRTFLSSVDTTRLLERAPSNTNNILPHNPQRFGLDWSLGSKVLLEHTLIPRK